MSFVKGLRCRECGKEYPARLQAGCEDCFAPLEVDYDYAAISKSVSQERIASRPASLWRYRELLPIEVEPVVGLASGWTPLVRADRLGRKLGLDHLYLKNDSVSYPTLSFKDRVTSMAVNKALEFKLEAVGCASTGNLANSVAAQAAAAGLPAYILIPESLERSKITATQIYGARVIAVRGNYDDVNRLCAQISERHPWGFVNVNLRPFYAEGSKTMGFEIAEQLGWQAPTSIVVPMAGGALLSKIHKGLGELERVGLLKEPVKTRLYGAQAVGCNPIVDAVRRKSIDIRPVKPNTIAKSLAIGNPADDDATDPEISEGISLLAETQGIYTETAGGVSIAVLKKLVDNGHIDRHGTTVVAITGNGLKTPEAVALNTPDVIDAKIEAFERVVEGGVAHVA
jgi:threonine synthase